MRCENRPSKNEPDPQCFQFVLARAASKRLYEPEVFQANAQRSEAELQTKLNIARRRRRLNDAVGIRVHLPARLAEVGVVEQVEELRSELDAPAFVRNDRKIEASTV